MRRRNYLRADIVISRLKAPASCVAPLILDRARLAATGAVTLRFGGGGPILAASRSADEDRPWSRPPRVRKGRAPMQTPEVAEDTSVASGTEAGQE